MAPLDARFMQSLYDDYVKFLNSGFKHTRMLWEFHNMTETLRISQRDTAFPNRGAFGNLMISPVWEREEDDEVGLQWAKDIHKKVQAEFERTRKGENNIDEDTKTAAREYSNYDGTFLCEHTDNYSLLIVF